MSTRLERLLQNIVPVPDRIDRYCDEALNNFAPPPPLIEDWSQYCAFLARLHCHLECRALGIGARPPDSRFDLSRCWALLKAKFGDSAPQAAFEIARTGAQGGVRQLLRTVARLYSRRYAENLISIAVEAYCSNRTTDELLADADEYIRNYRQIMPSELTEGSGARIHANLRKALKQHPYVIRRLRHAAG
ncbi:MAG: hypothetical protein WCL11_24505 [Verrucomicrobiota bacterium]